MKSDVEKIIRAVLYQGCLLYPYRSTSPKNSNQEVFALGRIYPQLYCEQQQYAEPCVMQAECLLHSHDEHSLPRVKVEVGFLQPLRREVLCCVGEVTPQEIEAMNSRVAVGALSAAFFETEDREPKFQRVPRLEVKGKVFESSTEAVERRVSVMTGLFPHSRNIRYSFPATKNLEAVLNDYGNVAGILLRHQDFIEGRIEIITQLLEKNLFKISVRVSNSSPLGFSEMAIPECVLQRTFASTHFVLEAHNAEFISLLETPEEFKTFAADCENIGCWPVLVGTKPAHTTMLASPVILFDYPQVARENMKDIFGEGEADEITAARVLPSAAEKECVISADDLGRKIPESAQNVETGEPSEIHLPIRHLPPLPDSATNRHFFNSVHSIKSIFIGGREVYAGDKVFLRPKHHVDQLNSGLTGKVAIVQAIEIDAGDKIHLALVLEENVDAPGLAPPPGRRFFYGTDEVEPFHAEVTE